MGYQLVSLAMKMDGFGDLVLLVWRVLTCIRELVCDLSEQMEPWYGSCECVGRVLEHFMQFKVSLRFYLVNCTFSRKISACCCQLVKFV